MEEVKIRVSYTFSRGTLGLDGTELALDLNAEMARMLLILACNSLF